MHNQSNITESSFRNIVFNINQENAQIKNLKVEKSFDFTKVNNLIKDVPRDLNCIVKHEHISKQLLNYNEVLVRVYILTLNQLANRDTFLGDKSDPYVKISYNSVVYDEKDKHIDNSENVNWFKYYE